MLKELLPLLRKGDTIGLSIACETAAGPDPVAQPAQYRINVMPKLFTIDGEKGSDRLALNTPITITGTADELDSPAFADTLNRFASSATALRHTIDEVETAHQQAARNKKSEPARAVPKTAAAKPAARIVPKPGANKSNWKSRIKSKAGARSTPVSEAPADAAKSEAPASATPEPPKNAEAATPSLI